MDNCSLLFIEIIILYTKPGNIAFYTFGLPLKTQNILVSLDTIACAKLDLNSFLLKQHSVLF